MKRTSKKNPAKSDEFPNAELRRTRMLAYLNASRDALKCRLEKAAQLGTKANGLLAGPTMKVEVKKAK